MDLKIKTLEVKKNYLNHRVRKFSGLSNLYTEFIEFLMEDTVNKINKKVLNKKEKLYADFQKSYVDLANEEEIFNCAFNAKYAELKKQKRLEFRAYREKTNRKIAKLSKKEGNETLILELKQSISDFEKAKENEVEEISSKWIEEFQNNLAKQKKENPSSEKIESLKQEVENNIQNYRTTITDSLNNKKNKKIEKINKKINRLDKKLENNKEKLVTAITDFDLVRENSLKEENNKNIQKLEQRLNKANAELNTLKEKASVDVNNSKLEDELIKKSRLIETLNNELIVAKESLSTNKKSINDDEILNIQGLCMYFGGIKAVNDLSFSVKRNEVFGLIGPNGAGKTTVFNCITQFYKPTKGTITFRNKNNEIVNLVHEKVHNVILQGVVRTFQNLEVIKDITVLDNLLIAAHRNYTSNIFQHMLHTPLLKVEEKIITRRAMEVLDFMGLTNYKDMYAWGLPYGILKKIEIARTLMCEPQLIILDEPAAGLNDSETVELIDIIRKIRDRYNASILLVEHDMGLVMNVCDRICAISFGNLLGLGTPSEIQQNKAVQEAYLGVSED